MPKGICENCKKETMFKFICNLINSEGDNFGLFQCVECKTVEFHGWTIFSRYRLTKEWRALTRTEYNDKELIKKLKDA